MSKYIIIEHIFGGSQLAKRQEDGTYQAVDLNAKATLISLLEEIANDGSVSEEKSLENKPELTLDERQAELEALGYYFDPADAEYADDYVMHRDVNLTDEYGTTVFCRAGTREVAISGAEEHYNGTI